MYKLIEGGIIHPEGFFIPNDLGNRHWQEYLAWLNEPNTSTPADVPTQAQIDKDIEVKQAISIAKTWFSGQAAAIAFIRQTPEQQATQISGMTVAQKDTVLKYLAIAVSSMIKRELL